MTLPALRSRIAALLGSVAGFVEQNPWVAVTVLLLVYLPAVFDASRTKPLWHDELYTYYLSSAPSLRALWAESRHLDLNPPLLYLLTRASFHVFGVNTLATRLPEMAAFLVALLCLFAFVRRRIGALYALLAVAFVMESDIFQLAVEARPYALMFCFFGIALLSWQAAAATSGSAPRSSRRLALSILFLAETALFLSHVFSVALVAALVLAELYRAFQRRRIDWPLSLALLLPFAATVAYKPLFHNHGRAIYPSAFQPDGDTIFAFYINSVNRELVGLCLTAFAVLLLLGRRHLGGGQPSTGRPWFFSPPEWVVVIWLMLLPLLLMADLMLHHAAFFPRYGAIETFAVAILTAALLAHWTLDRNHLDPRPALLGSCIVLLMSGTLFVLPQQIAAHNVFPTIANSEPKPLPCQACQQTAALDPSLPLVDASGLTFLEMNHRESAAMLSRVYFLTDEAAAAQYAHANIFKHMPELVPAFSLAAHTQPYSDFLHEHPHFFVFGRYDYPEDWLLRKLTADGASIRVLGRTADDYRDTELYEVEIPAAVLAHLAPTLPDTPDP